MRTLPPSTLAVWLLLCSAAAVEVRGDVFDYTGYNDLLAELGGSMPTGANVKVTLVEANSDSNLDEDFFPIDGSYDFIPNTGQPQFAGKTFTIYIPPGTSGADVSGHAHNVATKWFGLSPNSMAPGVTEIAVYEANHWLETGRLEFAAPDPPSPSDDLSRIANHGYVGTTNDATADLHLLERIDWLVHTDNFIQVVGSTGNSPIHNHAFNVISVGRLIATGTHGGLSTALPDATYAPGRITHDLLAIEGAASDASARVASAAAMLVEVAHDNPGLSNGSVTDRNAQTIYHGETGEVVQALLMAGADRDLVTETATSGAPYTVNSTNGLNLNYGAGVVNVYQPYHMLAAGEHDSIEDGGPATAGRYGFDYDTAFGGDNASNTQATYRFSASATITEFAASLVWFVDIDIAEVIAGNEDTAADLVNLDLRLYRETGGGDVLIASSLSTIENTENIWLKDLVAGDYKLVVGAVGGPFEWDYGLAWRASTVPAPTSLAALLALVAPVAFRRGRRGRLNDW